MWGDLWLQSNYQEDPGAGAGEDGELPGQVAKGRISGVCIWGRGRLRGSSGFRCAKAQCLCLNSCACVADLCFVCVLRGVQRKREDRKVSCSSLQNSQDPLWMGP